ncbi:glycosyltransferase [Alteromonas aestuariivivens]|uniref:Glycosyltransferase n=2 Tax=Alteromonas aestuariivivens TaxID=1938339 RepID=A0A3D8MBM6_9ALTE|nr:glycosyltransferase [Alteromonas aestuariivivens]
MQGLITTLRDMGWRVTFLTAATDSTHKWDLTSLYVTSETIALNCSTFNQTIESLAPDIVVFDRFMTEEQFSWRVRKVCPHAALVLNTEDLHSLRNARHEAIKQGRDAMQPELNSELACREVAAILRSDLSLIISDYEYRLLTQHYGVPVSSMLHLPLLLDETSEVTPPFKAREGFVTIGNFRHAPNWDAVLQLKQKIWPHIRKQLPDAHLTIYGAYPPKKATALSDKAQGFQVAGWVSDAAEALRQARVLLAPLRFGAGVKGKLLSAMQCGTPSVTTPIGAEGIGAAEQWPGAVCSSESDFIESAVRLYTQPNEWQSSCARIPALLQKKFNSKTNCQTLQNALLQLVESLTARRNSNFLQQLLWHHSLRSTQYMSQWIEEKNRPR